MTEEIINKENEDNSENPSKEELRATEGGWRPKEEWEGEDGEWIDAQTFNMRGELLDRIKSQTSQLRGQDRKISKLENTLKDLSEHNKRMDEIAFKRALNELKSLKKDAMQLDDHDQIVEIDDQILELKAAQKESSNKFNDNTTEDDVNNVSPEIIDWIEQNQWYKTDVTLRGAADALTLDIIQTYPELKNNPSEVLKKVSNRLKDEFPNKFGKTQKPKQSVAEPSDADTQSKSKGTSKTSKYTSRHLNEVQMEIGKTFVETGAMKNLNEYAEQLAEIGELDVQKGA